MRDIRDAKSMAHSLRSALKIKAVQITHSDSLELIAKAFGFDNWNVLSAQVAADASSVELADFKTRVVGSEAKKARYCTFCCKSEYEVSKLIAGPTAFICDACVKICVHTLGEGSEPRL